MAIFLLSKYKCLYFCLYDLCIAQVFVSSIWMSVYFLGDTCEPLLNVCQFQIDLGGHIGLCRMFEKNKNKTNKQWCINSNMENHCVSGYVLWIYKTARESWNSQILVFSKKFSDKFKTIYESNSEKTYLSITYIK